MCKINITLSPASSFDSSFKMFSSFFSLYQNIDTIINNTIVTITLNIQTSNSNAVFLEDLLVPTAKWSLIRVCCCCTQLSNINIIMKVDIIIQQSLQ